MMNTRQCFNLLHTCLWIGAAFLSSCEHDNPRKHTRKCNDSVVTEKKTDCNTLVYPSNLDAAITPACDYHFDVLDGAYKGSHFYVVNMDGYISEVTAREACKIGFEIIPVCTTDLPDSLMVFVRIVCLTPLEEQGVNCNTPVHVSRMDAATTAEQDYHFDVLEGEFKSHHFFATNFDQYKSELNTGMVCKIAYRILPVCTMDMPDTLMRFVEITCLEPSGK